MPLRFMVMCGTTNDLDIFFRPSPENISKIENALANFGFPKGSVSLKDFYDQGSIIRMGLPPVRIVMINTISGLTFDEVWEHKVSESYGNVNVFYIGFNELIKKHQVVQRILQIWTNLEY
jgi:hypothetical protein